MTQTAEFEAVSCVTSSARMAVGAGGLDSVSNALDNVPSGPPVADYWNGTGWVETKSVDP